MCTTIRYFGFLIMVLFPEVLRVVQDVYVFLTRRVHIRSLQDSDVGFFRPLGYMHPACSAESIGHFYTKSTYLGGYLDSKYGPFV